MLSSCLNELALFTQMKFIRVPPPPERSTSQLSQNREGTPADLSALHCIELHTARPAGLIMDFSCMDGFKHQVMLSCRAKGKKIPFKKLSVYKNSLLTSKTAAN